MISRGRSLRIRDGPSSALCVASALAWLLRAILVEKRVSADINKEQSRGCDTLELLDGGRHVEMMSKNEDERLTGVDVALIMSYCIACFVLCPDVPLVIRASKRPRTVARDTCTVLYPITNLIIIVL